LTTWNLVRLGDHVDLLAGYPFPSAKFTSAAHSMRLLKGSVVSQGALDWNGAVGWPSNDTNEYRKFELSVGDIVLAMDRPWIEAGLKYAWITPDDIPCLLVQRVARLRGRNGLDTAFLRDLIGSPGFMNYVRPIVTGVNVPHISPRQISSFRFKLPPLPLQRKIAAILSTYDDLINNDSRRIVLLEEIARRIYREWFVDYRYPGHLNVPLVDSSLGPIPDGWLVKRMDEVANVIDCLHSTKPQQAVSGTGILLQLFNVRSGGLIDLTNKFMVSAAAYEQWTSRIELRQGDCVITNVGRVAAIGQIPVGVKAAPGRNMTAVRPRSIPPTYLLQYLLSEHMQGEVRKKKDAGSIMDSLNVKGIVRLAVPVPNGTLTDEFERLVRPMRRQIEVLERSRQLLRRTRDYLLPRLISGDVDVTDLNIKPSKSVA
jgi:type I restriction enzyme S subunit